MPQDIQIKLSPAAAALVSDATASRVLGAISTEMQKQSLLTIGQASEKRMNFPGDGPTTLQGLRHRTGHLLRSLRATTTVSGDEVRTAIGSNLRYFGVHEFGFQGTQQVKAHTRKGPARVRLGAGGVVNLAAATKLGLVKKGGTLKKGVGILVGGGLINVRAHERKANFPARMMIQKTIAERQQEVETAISNAVEKALTSQ
jgi:phage gpG-like protein